MSYDNTAGLGHSTWRHVKFVERTAGAASAADGSAGYRSNVFRWDFTSDVCKHCEHAGCLEACPDRLDRPHRVRRRIHPARCLQRLRLLRRHLPVRRRRSPARRRAGVQVHVLLRPPEGRARAGVRDRVPDRIDSVRRPRRACARARTRASSELQARGIDDAVVYDPVETSVGGTHAIFVVRGDPEDYNLPRAPGGSYRPSASRLGGAAVAAGLIAAGHGGGVSHA